MAQLMELYIYGCLGDGGGPGVNLGISISLAWSGYMGTSWLGLVLVLLAS